MWFYYSRSSSVVTAYSGKGEVIYRVTAEEFIRWFGEEELLELA